MYNGIGLTTPRGSGTNGHVQRNWAFVRPGKKDSVTYKTEDDLAKLDAASNRHPNQDILDHERKRKIEVKCAEFEEILEKQGCCDGEVKEKVDIYRSKLMGQGKAELPKDDFGRVLVRETHQIAEAQQEKNAKLREAFGISEYFVEGSSFDPERKAREELAKVEALQKELQAQKDNEKVLMAAVNTSKPYVILRTPPMMHDGKDDADNNGGCGNGGAGKKKKKSKRNHDETGSVEERKREKKKKSKKSKRSHKKKSGKQSKKKHRRRNHSSDNSVSDSMSDSSSSDSEADKEENVVKKQRKSKKEKKTKKDRKKKRTRHRSNSSDSSVVSSPERVPRNRSKSPNDNRLKRRRSTSHNVISTSNANLPNNRKSRSRDRKRRSQTPVHDKKRAMNKEDIKKSRRQSTSSSRDKSSINKRVDKDMDKKKRRGQSSPSKRQEGSPKRVRKDRLSSTTKDKKRKQSRSLSKEKKRKVARSLSKDKKSVVKRSRSSRSVSKDKNRKNAYSISKGKKNKNLKSDSVEKRRENSQSPSCSKKQRKCRSRSNSKKMRPKESKSPKYVRRNQSKQRRISKIDSPNIATNRDRSVSFKRRSHEKQRENSNNGIQSTPKRQRREKSDSLKPSERRHISRKSNSPKHSDRREVSVKYQIKSPVKKTLREKSSSTDRLTSMRRLSPMAEGSKSLLSRQMDRNSDSQKRKGNNSVWRKSLSKEMRNRSMEKKKESSPRARENSSPRDVRNHSSYDRHLNDSKYFDAEKDKCYTNSTSNGRVRSFKKRHSKDRKRTPSNEDRTRKSERNHNKTERSNLSRSERERSPHREHTRESRTNNPTRRKSRSPSVSKIIIASSMENVKRNETKQRSRSSSLSTTRNSNPKTTSHTPQRKSTTDNVRKLLKSRSRSYSSSDSKSSKSSSLCRSPPPRRVAEKVHDNQTAQVEKRIQNTRNSRDEKRKPQPVVRLHSDGESTDRETPTSKIDELINPNKSDELKELNLLKAISAKAKEKIKSIEMSVNSSPLPPIIAPILIQSLDKETVIPKTFNEQSVVLPAMKDVQKSSNEEMINEVKSLKTHRRSRKDIEPIKQREDDIDEIERKARLKPLIKPFKIVNEGTSPTKQQILGGPTSMNKPSPTSEVSNSIPNHLPSRRWDAVEAVVASPEIQLSCKVTQRKSSRSRSKTPLAQNEESILPIAGSQLSQQSDAGRKKSRSHSSRSYYSSSSSSHSSGSSRSRSSSSSSSSSAASSNASSRRRKHSSSRSRSRSRSPGASSRSRSHSENHTSRSRSPSIPRRRGSPSFLDRRRITRNKSAR